MARPQGLPLAQVDLSMARTGGTRFSARVNQGTANAIRKRFERLGSQAGPRAVAYLADVAYRRTQTNPSFQEGSGAVRRSIQYRVLASYGRGAAKAPNFLLYYRPGYGHVQPGWQGYKLAWRSKGKDAAGGGPAGKGRHNGENVGEILEQTRPGERYAEGFRGQHSTLRDAMDWLFTGTVAKSGSARIGVMHNPAGTRAIRRAISDAERGIGGW